MQNRLTPAPSHAMRDVMTMSSKPVVFAVPSLFLAVVPLENPAPIELEEITQPMLSAGSFVDYELYLDRITKIKLHLTL